MDLLEAIEKRRTIRVYKDKAPEEQLRLLLTAGSMAPSGLNRQPWEFIVIDDKKVADGLAEIKYQMNRVMPPPEGETAQDVEAKALFQKRSFDNASIVAVCCIAGQTPGAWLAVENISLAALAYGLGTGIVGYFGERKKEAEKLLGLSEDYEIRPLQNPQLRPIPSFRNKPNHISLIRRPDFVSIRGL